MLQIMRLRCGQADGQTVAKVILDKKTGLRPMPHFLCLHRLSRLQLTGKISA